MEQRYGERGAAVGRRMAQGQLLDAAFTMPLVEDVVERAQGLIVHSDHLRGLAQRCVLTCRRPRADGRAATTDAR